MKTYMEKILEDVFSYSDNISDYAGTSTTSDSCNKFSLEDLDKFKLYMNKTPEEKTLEATGGKYNLILVPDTKILFKMKNRYGDLNFKIFNNDNNNVYLLDTRFKPIMK